MIDQYTTFIFGAGANSSYGYPSGKELRDLIIKRFPSLYQIRRPNAIDLDSANEFCDALDQSSDTLIDYLLDTCNNPKYVRLGKLAIILFIAEAEERSVTKRNIEFTEDDWFPILFNKMVGQLKYHNGIKTNKVAFITFNYDRFLENRLNYSIKHKYGISWEETNKIVKCYPVEHVFNRLPLLFFEDINSKSMYGDKISNDDIIRTAKSIKILSERHQIDKDKIINIIMKSHRIFFLGFGFNNENLKILDINDSIDNSVSIYATAFGLDDKKIDESNKILWKDYAYKESIRAHIYPFQNKLMPEPIFEKVKCRELLEKYL